MEFDGACGHEGCRFVAQSRSELANHRRKLGHPKKTKLSSTEEETGEQPNHNSSVGKELELKYKCDTQGCSYVSRYRTNLVRHCK